MITLTEEQIEAGRAAMLERTPTWKPMPPEAVRLAHDLYERFGRMSDRKECVAVGRLLGWHPEKVWQRYRMGEMGLPTPFVARAAAFAAGEVFYVDPAGVERYVNDNERTVIPIERHQMESLRAKFDGVTKEFLRGVAAPKCPSCGVTFERGAGEASASFDHLVPGVRSLNNARMICRLCNLTKLDATPKQLHLIADWMALQPEQMFAKARDLPPLEGFVLNSWDGRRQLLAMKKYAAKKAGVEFSLALGDVVWSSHCPVLGVEFDLPGQGKTSKKGPRRNSLSFDRIDPNKGYIPGNVVLVSHQANSIMGNATGPERIRQVADWFDRELEAAPELAALIDQDDTRAHWLMSDPTPRQAESLAPRCWRVTARWSNASERCLRY